MKMLTDFPGDTKKATSDAERKADGPSTNAKCIILERRKPSSVPHADKLSFTRAKQTITKPATAANMAYAELAGQVPQKVICPDTNIINPGHKPTSNRIDEPTRSLKRAQ